MVLWLLHHHVNFYVSFANGTIIFDRAVWWYQMLAITGHASCDSKQTPNLLGLVIWQVFLSLPFSNDVYVAKWSYEFSHRARWSHSVSHMSRLWLSNVPDWAGWRLPLPEKWRHADASAVSEIPIFPLIVTHKPHQRYAFLITIASGKFGSAWKDWCYLIWQQKCWPRAPLFVEGTFASLILLLFLSFAIMYVTYCKYNQILFLLSHNNFSCPPLDTPNMYFF